MSLDRRDFLKLSAAGIAIGVFPGCATSGSEIVSKKGQRVVIVGGGFGGATAAKHIRMWSDNKIGVVLIERNPTFISCPMSNTVLGGSRTISPHAKLRYLEEKIRYRNGARGSHGH